MAATAEIIDLNEIRRQRQTTAQPVMPMRCRCTGDLGCSMVLRARLGRECLADEPVRRGVAVRDVTKDHLGGIIHETSGDLEHEAHELAEIVSSNLKRLRRSRGYSLERLANYGRR